MILNYLKIALRNIIRNKAFSFINIAGLTMGMAACLLMLLFIQRELSFENFIGDANRIYRVLTIDKALGTHNQRVGITMPAFGLEVTEKYPEIESATRLSFGGETLLRYEENPPIYAQRFRSADPNFLEFFGIDLIRGDPATALAEPYSVVLTKSLAKQFFGDDEGFGKTLVTGNGNDLLITGIMDDMPENTHLQFDALGTLLTQAALARENQPEGSTDPIWVESWNLVAMPTYAKFRPGAIVEGYDSTFTQFIRDNDVEENFFITLQPLYDVHLKSKDVIFDPVQNKGDIDNVYIFIAIALLTLIIAAVNYVNLSTARSANRAKEVGIRKVIGSMKQQLIIQFIGESILITFISIVLAFPLATIALPWLNNLAGASLEINILNNGVLLIFCLMMIVFVGIMAGLYPAIVLSSFRPVTVLKGSLGSGKKGNILRKALVVFQFSLSIALICLTLIVQNQMHFVNTKDMGYDREQVLIVDIQDREMAENIEIYRNELLNHSGFGAAALVGNIPGRTFGRTRIRPEGASDDENWIWSVLSTTPEALPTLGMEIVQGRNFSREMGTDTSGVVLMNETAVQQLGWENPLDKRLYFGDDDSVGVQIVGIVKDFHFAGLHQFIEPVVMFFQRNPGGVLIARINSGAVPESMKYAGEKWTEIFPNRPFKYKFMDEEFENLYRRDINTATIINSFSMMAIFIACLGLFGLASHSTAQRTKEIGIRKVVGASAPTIIRILVSDFVKWVLISNIFAFPLAYFAASKWLGNFAYRVDINAVPFIAAALVSLIIAILTVLGKSWHAATSDPVKALRYE